MLSKAYRMTGNEFLKIVGKKPAIFYVSHNQKTIASVAQYEHTEDFGSKYAISLSKKVAKTSVLRHRIKRRIMSILEIKLKTDLQTTKNSKKLFIIIRIHDKSIENIDFKCLQEKLTKI
jgi:ribonuclease P protein component